MAFFGAACWSVVVLANKSVLALVNPLPVNMFVRCVSLTTMLAITLPLTLFDWWDLGFGLSASAALYIAASATLTWVVSFNTYYYALRAGNASVVAPVTNTDPIWTALFAPLILGVALTAPTVLGLVIATLGVALIGRWMDAGSEAAAAAADVGWAVSPGEQASTGSRSTSRFTVILLSMITAAGWGLSPVIIQLAERENGGASTTMMLESQVLGVLLLLAIVRLRRERILVRPIDREERRRVIWLLIVAGVFEALFAVIYYLVIAELGAVLTVVIMATSPLFSLLGSAVLLKERVGLRLVIATAITLSGVAIATIAQ